MGVKKNEDFEMTFENRYKIFTVEKRAKYINNLYEPYIVRGLSSDVLKNSPKYQFPHDRQEGYLKEHGHDEKGFYAIFLPTENEYEKIKAFAEIKDKLEKLSNLANLQRQLVDRNKSFSELNTIEKNIDELYIDIFNNNPNPTPNSTDNKNKQIKNNFDKHWFKVGLFFADGTIQKLYKELESGTKVAIQLGNKNYRPYITETYNNTTKRDKNIYCSFVKMKVIYDYCIERNIGMCNEFKDVYNKIKPY